MPDQDGFEPDPSGFTPDPDKSWYEDIFTVPNAIRFGGSALGSVAAGAAASTGVGILGSSALMAGGGALGEAGARWWEGKPFDPTITATEGVLNLLPGGGEIPGKGAALSKIGKYALQQAGHGAWQGAVGAFPRKQAEEGNLLDPSKWEAPSWGEIGNQAVAGGAIGGVTGGTLGAANAKFGKAKPSIAPPVDVPPPFEHPPVKPNDYIYQPDKSSARPIGEGESILDYITGRDEQPAPPVQRAAPIEPVAPQPQAAFDPNTLTGLQRTEVEFVDPTTGEVRSSADARPGDVPVPNEPKAAAPQSAVSTVAGWIDELVKDESGELTLGRMADRVLGHIRETHLGSEGEPATKSAAADAFAEAPTTAARAARRVDPDVVMPSVRSQIDGMGDEHVQNLINTFEGNPTAYGESGRNAALYGRDVIEARAAERAANPQAQAPIRHGDISEQLTQALPPAPAAPVRPSTELNRIVNGVSGHTRAIIDSYDDRGLLDFIRRHNESVQNSPEGASANISRNMAAYATEVAQSRGLNLPAESLIEGNSRPEGARQAPAEPIPDNVPLQRESYAEIANAIRRMTGEEATAYVNENSDSLNPTDIQPLIDELMSESPTSGSRAAVRFLESRGGRAEPVQRTLPVKPPVEVTPEMRERSRKRLAAIGGAERADKLISGESVLGNLAEPTIPRSIRGRPNRGEKLRPEEAEFWNKWADEQIRNSVTPDPNKPGMTIEPEARHFPKYLRIQYRDAQGNPIGYLSTDLAGSGVQILAASPKLGLGRGRVAFAMLKEAFDRGITKAHGSTSDHTKNLINRVGKLIQGNDEGSFDLDVVAQQLVDIMNGTVRAAKAVSRFGKKAIGEVSRFFNDDRGAVNIDRLQELFQKKQSGTLTPEELAEAKALAQEAKSAPAAETSVPAKTGQVTWSDTRKKKPAVATTTPAPALPKAASLPAELAGAKPRFNIGADSYSPSFADDLDKALFIIAQKTRSKSDHKYLQFVMEQTGMDEASARLAGQGVRTTIKNQLSGQAPGVVRIESIWRKNQQPAASTAAPAAKVTAQEAGNGTIAKAANESPAVKQQTPEQAVAASMEAEAATASLAKRLKRAVENPNPANSQYEIDELLDEAAAAVNKLPEGQRAGYIRKVLGANKALLTAWDLSAPGRQGKAFIFNKAWWTSLDDMVKAWGSAKAADAVAQSIRDHPSGFFKQGVDKFGKPTASFAERMGLDLAGVEELFTTNKGSAFEKYSGVGKSSRAHTAFLNKLRSDQFVAMMESATKLGLDPQANLHQAQTYAKFINDATGRGSLNVGKWKLERNLGAINDVMFAPKNLSGQIRTWNAVLNPMKYASYDPVMRQQALRSLLAIAGSGLVVGELAKLMGGKVVDDPASSDFRKIRVGDTRIDLFGGYQQFPVAAMKFLMNRETPTSGRDAGRQIDFDKGGAFRNRATVASRFFTNRLSPAGSFVWAWMNNREFDGKPFEVKRALYERTAPIVLKDLYELAKDDPALAAIMTPTNTLGLTGTQTYGRN